MLSTSQIMRLSGELSSLYPQGFGLELIDRAESLGKSIFTFTSTPRTDPEDLHPFALAFFCIADISTRLCDPSW